MSYQTPCVGRLYSQECVAALTVANRQTLSKGPEDGRRSLVRLPTGRRFPCGPRPQQLGIPLLHRSARRQGRFGAGTGFSWSSPCESPGTAKTQRFSRSCACLLGLCSLHADTYANSERNVATPSLTLLPSYRSPALHFYPAFQDLRTSPTWTGCPIRTSWSDKARVAEAWPPTKDARPRGTGGLRGYARRGRALLDRETSFCSACSSRVRPTR